MARKSEYPDDRSLIARIRCVMEANSAMRSLLRSILDLQGVELNDESRKRLRGMIDEALAKAELASNAISGEEP